MLDWLQAHAGEMHKSSSHQDNKQYSIKANKTWLCRHMNELKTQNISTIKCLLNAAEYCNIQFVSISFNICNEWGVTQNLSYPAYLVS